jgi:hypothetical protein
MRTKVQVLHNLTGHWPATSEACKALIQQLQRAADHFKCVLGHGIHKGNARKASATSLHMHKDDRRAYAACFSACMSKCKQQQQGHMQAAKYTADTQANKSSADKVR